MTELTPTPDRPYRTFDAETWAAVQAAYEEGLPTVAVAERFGMDPRNVRRRAAAEHWRRPKSNDRFARALECLRRGRVVPDVHGEDAMETDPGLAEVIEVHSEEVAELLMQPAPEGLSRYAFRRSVEAAVRAGYAETLGWLRVVNAIDRSAHRLEREAHPFAASDYLRGVMVDSFTEGAEAHAAGDPMPDVR